LTDKQMRRLDVLVCRGPKANGFATYAWSVAWVAELIEREFGARYKPANVRRILRILGLYMQRRVKVEKARRLRVWPTRPRSFHQR
jgi:transposase